MRKITALICAMLVLLFTACPPDNGDDSGDKAVLSAFRAESGSLRVNGMLGEAVSASQWSGLSGRAGLSQSQTGEMYFDDAPGPVVCTFTASASPNAAVTYAVARGEALPQESDFTALSAQTPPLAENYAAYAKVVSGNKQVTNYYYVKITGITGSAPSDNTAISGVQIGGGAAVTPSGGSALAGTVTPALYELPYANTTGAVTLQLTRFANQTVSWAKVGAGDAAPADSAFTEFDQPASGNALSAEISSNGLASGDTVYLKVTAADKITRRYYGFTITAGNIARLASLSIGGRQVTMPGTPGAAWDAIGRGGTFYYDDANPPGTFALAASAEDNGAVAYAVITGAAEPSFINLNGTANAALANGSKLYIRVTSANESETAFYRIDAYLKNAVTILYGQPVISAGAGGIGGVPVMDPLWDTQDWIFNAGRPNLTVSPLDDERSMFLNTLDGHYNDIGYGHTEARAKAFWDDGGLYVYLETVFHDYNEYNGTAPPTTGERETRVTPSSDTDAHLYDSLEVFTNERVQQYTSGNFGVQYRVGPSVEGASAAGTNSRITGEAPAGSAAVATFRDSGKYYSWIRKDGAGKELGYSILAYIPWAFKTDADANQVFGSDGKVLTTGNNSGPAIGMELQINAVAFNPSPGINELERAVIAWNGAGDPYQQVSHYGKVTLITGDLAARGIVRE